MRSTVIQSFSKKGRSGRNVPLRHNTHIQQAPLNKSSKFLNKRHSMNRPSSPGSTRAKTVQDFDWYGNSNQINHLVKGNRKEKNLQMVGFETQLRAYA